MSIEYHAVFQDGEFMKRDSLEQLSLAKDYVCLVKKVEITPLRANTYGYYDFLFVNRSCEDCVAE